MTRGARVTVAANCTCTAIILVTLAAAILFPRPAPAQPEPGAAPLVGMVDSQVRLKRTTRRHQRALVRAGRAAVLVAPFEENVLVDPPEPEPRWVRVEPGVLRVQAIRLPRWQTWCDRIGGLEC